MSDPRVPQEIKDQIAYIGKHALREVALLYAESLPFCSQRFLPPLGDNCLVKDLSVPVRLVRDAVDEGKHARLPDGLELVLPVEQGRGEFDLGHVAHPQAEPREPYPAGLSRLIGRRSHEIARERVLRPIVSSRVFSE